MQALNYLLPQPKFDLSAANKARFEALLEATPPGSWIDYSLAAPKWQFLSYLCQVKDLVLHGSQNTEIETVEPRKATDVKAFSNQDMIYATTDGIWVIYFAIVDRKRFEHLSLFNSCIDIRVLHMPLIGRRYFFSITHSALLQNPWCEGAVYILPRAGFQQEPAQSMLGAEIIFPHWISPALAQPLAKLRVGPQDFPYLGQVHGHNDEKLAQLAAENPNGFPWPAALES